MSMLQYFFEDERNWNDGSKKDNTHLFEGMKIMNEGYEDIIKYGMAFYRKDCLIKIGDI